MGATEENLKTILETVTGMRPEGGTLAAILASVADKLGRGGRIIVDARATYTAEQLAEAIRGDAWVIDATYPDTPARITYWALDQSAGTLSAGTITPPSSGTAGGAARTVTVASGLTAADRKIIKEAIGHG